MKSIMDQFSGEESKEDPIVFGVPLSSLSIKELQQKQVSFCSYSQLSVFNYERRIDVELENQRKKHAEALQGLQKDARYGTRLCSHEPVPFLERGSTREEARKATAKLKDEIKKLRQELDSIKKQGY